MKYVLYGDQSISKLNRRPHLSKDIDWRGGGIFKYYSLEQYEETLKNSSYIQINLEQTKNINYLFNASEKMTNLISVDGDNIIFDMDKLEEIDLPETIALLKGMKLTYIDEEKTILKSNNKTLEIPHDINSLKNEEKSKLLEILSPCIWWEA